MQKKTPTLCCIRRIRSAPQSPAPRREVLHRFVCRTSCIRIARRLNCLLLLCLLTGAAASAAAAFGASDATAGEAASAEVRPEPLQPWIDRAQPGATITIPAGAYSGPVVIDRPLTLQADGEVKLTGGGEQPVVTIRTNGASFRGFTIVDDRFKANLTAIAVQGDDNTVEGNTISSYMHGVTLRQAHRNRITGNRIIGLVNEFTKDQLMIRGNGIDLLESDDNTIEGNTISDKQDGVYAEKSDANRIERNAVRDARYALHVMFADDTVLRGNEGVHNVVGAIVMTAERTQALDNRFVKQSANVNAEGMLLYDVKRGTVRGNVLEGNRTGMRLDQTVDTLIEDNRFHANFVGLAVTASERNVLTGNRFLANVVDAQADNGLNNTVAGNYWDQAHGIDLTGSGRSSIGYAVNPFFLKLTSAYAPFQLFFQAPGLVFIEELFQEDSGQWFRDAAPLMKPPPDSGAAASADRHNIWPGLLLSAALLALSVTLIYRLGVETK